MLGLFLVGRLGPELARLESPPPQDGQKIFEYEEMAGLSTVRKVQFLFKKLDVSGDGDVSLDEFVELIAPDDELFATFRSLNPFSKMAVRPIV